MTYRFEMVMPSKQSLNKIYAGLYWRARNKLADEFHQAVAALNIDYKAVKFPVDISYTFKYKGRKLDVSNGAFMAKMIEDGLVHCGVIPDDTYKYVRSFQLFIEDGKFDKTSCIVEITEPL